MSVKSDSPEASCTAPPSPSASLSLQASLRIVLRHARRLIVLVIGTTVLLLGLIMLVTPGPGLIVIPIGLGILSLEFAWARRLLHRVREGIQTGMDWRNWDEWKWMVGLGRRPSHPSRAADGEPDSPQI